ncbi:MAG: putative tricarboxylic transport membrane protein, partial [Sulfitobacter sp.]
LSRDFVGGIATIIIGGFYLSLAYDLRSSALDDIVGPGGMPRAYGWAMVFLGLALCLATLLTTWRKNLDDQWKDQGRRILWAAGLLAIGICYLLIVNVVGYLVSMVMLIAATMVYHGERPSLKVLGTSVFGGTMLWALFVFVLGVHMPPGLLAYIGL